jgi:hypothetical protein
VSQLSHHLLAHLSWRGRNIGDVAGNLRGMDVYKLVGHYDPG